MFVVYAVLLSNSSSSFFSSFLVLVVRSHLDAMRPSVCIFRWMQRGGSSAAELMKTARHVERRRVAKLQKKQMEPNPYHKAQYVSAYVEAKSSMITQQKAIQRRHADAEGMTPPSLSQELTLLSKELQSSYGAKRQRHMAAREAETTHIQTAHRPKKESVAFGDWRRPVPFIERELHALDVRWHTIARGGLTPPSLSPEALKRRAAPLHGALRPLWGRFRRTCSASEAAALAADAVALLEGLQARKRLDQEEWPHVMSLCIQEFFSFNASWQTVFSFLESYLNQIRTVDGGEAFARDASQQIAVFAECVRFCNYGTDGPTLDRLSTLCQSAQNGRQAPLVPLAAAPLLSTLHRTNEGDEPEKVHAFVTSYLLQRGGGARVYMPSSAWGEYIKALHRFGASAAEVQALVDRCTDEEHTVKARQHLSSAHVWNAYLSCSEGSHALEVYRKNKAHYGIGERDTIAALMSALAQAGTSSSSKQALELFKVLLQR
ncbi:hypothetical protein STCU_01319, partial [Strigomonas culicis]